MAHLQGVCPLTAPADNGSGQDERRPRWDSPADVDGALSPPSILTAPPPPREGVELSAMTDAELGAERLALLVEEDELQQAHQRLHLRPDDRPGHAAHRERLKPTRIALKPSRMPFSSESAEPPGLPVLPALQETRRLPRVCPVCESPSITPSRQRDSYRCLRCTTAWIMG